MKIYFATDHAGFELKQQLLAYVKHDLGYDVEDYGAFDFDPLDDFTDFVQIAASRVAENPDGVRAIILGGSGQGEAMCANRFLGVRTAVYYGGSLDIIKLSREHNDANMLSLGARFISLEEAQKAVKLLLETPFSDVDKYARRNAKLDIL